jgi:hypothetical protein
MAALGGLFIAAMAASLPSLGGCATSNTPPRPGTERASSETPDGGWQNYRPPRRDYDPDPNRTSAQDPISAPIVPITPGSPTVSPNVH